MTFNKNYVNVYFCVSDLHLYYFYLMFLQLNHAEEIKIFQPDIILWYLIFVNPHHYGKQLFSIHSILQCTQTINLRKSFCNVQYVPIQFIFML